MTPTALAALCNTLLSADEFNDYCPNGLQVEGTRPIKKIITGVTACQALINEAIKHDADTLLVHHGYFWKGESAPLVGIKGARIRTLLQHDMSLLAYHLPLDAHPTLGNNATLANLLNLTISGALFPNEKYPVGNVATCEPISANDLLIRIETALKRPPLYIQGRPNNQPIQTIGLCTGGAQDMIEQAYIMGCDAFISGEISERTTHMARELGIDY
ncbi:MAG: Nif3-like dinuclear metal center hexameric protein, partial [Moraxella sp.]|nr:Nif3-like dinuclear metal center hexameric protein [Moraxella sp.]